MEYVSDYKYLGCWVNEFGKAVKTVDVLTSAAGRLYGRIVGIMKQLGSMGYRTFLTLYKTYVLPVANYGAGVWGYKNFSAPQVLQHRINKFYLGVGRYAANSATSIEMDVMDTQHSLWLEMLRYMNQIRGLKEGRLPKIMLNWDKSKGGRGWWSDRAHLPQPNRKVLHDLDSASNILLCLSWNGWWAEAETKSKIRRFCVFNITGEI